MTPLDKVFMLSTDDVLDEKMLRRVVESGHSRVPIHRAGDCTDLVRACAARGARALLCMLRVLRALLLCTLRVLRGAAVDAAGGPAPPRLQQLWAVGPSG